jgi:hypothetical protein
MYSDAHTKRKMSLDTCTVMPTQREKCESIQWNPLLSKTDRTSTNNELVKKEYN